MLLFKSLSKLNTIILNMKVHIRYFIIYKDST